MVENKSDHPIDSQHLQTTHQHATDTVQAQHIFDEENHQINDCHHCGHCSGFHLSWIEGESSIMNINKRQERRWPNRFQVNSGYNQPLLRPPIS